MNPLEYITILFKKYSYLDRVDIPNREVIKKDLERYINNGDKAQGGVARSNKIGKGEFFAKGKNKIPFSFKGSYITYKTPGKKHRKN